MIDIHAHILADIDDGPRDWTNALKLAKFSVQSGIKTVVATPHYQFEGKINCREAIVEKVKQLQSLLEEAGIPLKVLPGTEIMIKDYPSEIIKPELITTLNDTGKYVLIEMPADSYPEVIEEAIPDFRESGLVPIIAHPERNRRVMNEPNTMLRFIELGALIQLNASSLTGKSGYSVMRTAEILLYHNMVHFLASDMHSFETRAPHLARAAKKAEKLVGGDMVKALVKENPQKVLKGESIHVEQPERYRRCVGMLWCSGKMFVQQLRASQFIKHFYPAANRR